MAIYLVMVTENLMRSPGTNPLLIISTISCSQLIPSTGPTFQLTKQSWVHPVGNKPFLMVGLLVPHKLGRWEDQLKTYYNNYHVGCALGDTLQCWQPLAKGLKLVETTLRNKGWFKPRFPLSFWCFYELLNQAHVKIYDRCQVALKCTLRT